MAYGSAEDYEDQLGEKRPAQAVPKQKQPEPEPVGEQQLRWMMAEMIERARAEGAADALGSVESFAKAAMNMAADTKKAAEGYSASGSNTIMKAHADGLKQGISAVLEYIGNEQERTEGTKDE